MIFKSFSILFAIGFLSRVSCYSLKSVEEGECVHTPNAKTNFNMTWFLNTKVPYFVAGSKFNMFMTVCAQPDFAKLKDYNFYYESCSTYEANVTGGFAHIYGYGGRVLGRSDFLPYVVPGTFDLNFTPYPKNESSLEKYLVRHYITAAKVTDEFGWVFFNNCWVELNQKSWSVLATRKNLAEEEKRMIEEHAISLGFDADKMAFFRWETCPPES